VEVLNLVVCAALVLGVCALFLLPDHTRSRRPHRPHRTHTYPETRDREWRDTPIPPRRPFTPRRRTPYDNN